MQPGPDDEEPPDPDELGWPDADIVGDGAKALLDARLDVRKKRVDEEIARAKAEVDNDLAQNLEYQKALLEVAKGSLERGRASADTVQKAASAISVVYSVALGVAFSVSDHPLPPRGVLPAVFLGTAIVLATVYLAYLTPSRGVSAPDPLLPPGPVAQVARVAALAEWTGQAAKNRAYWLRASVLALGVGVLLLPVPFLQTSHDRTASVAWPSENGLPADAELRKILYTAQVEQAADAAKRASTAPDDNQDGLIILTAVIVGLGVVIAGPLVIEAASTDAGGPAPPGGFPGLSRARRGWRA